MYSMAFTSLIKSFEVGSGGVVDVEIPTIVVVAVVIVVDVEAPVCTIVARGTTSSGIIASCAFYSSSLISLFIFSSMSLICAFRSIINLSMYSFWLSFSPTSFSCISLIANILTVF